MNYDVVRIDQIVRNMLVKVDAETFSQHYQKSLQKFSKNVQVAGFRRGKAPIPTVKRLYEKQINAYYKDEYITKYLMDGLKETGINPISVLDDVKMRFTETGEAIFEYQIEVLPDGFDYEFKGLDVIFKPKEFEESLLDSTIENILLENTEEIPFDENDTLQMGDLVKIGGIKSDIELPLVELKKDIFESHKINHFREMDTEKIVGLRINDKFLSNSDCEYIIIDAFKQKKPDLSDDIAKKLGYDNVEKFKEAVTDNILNDIKEENNNVLNYRIAEAYGNHNVDKIMIPDDYLVSYGKRLFKSTMAQNAANDMYDKMPVDFYREIAEIRKAQLVYDLSYDQIAKDNDISVTEEELDAEIIKIAEVYKLEADKLKSMNPEMVENLTSNILKVKVLEFIRPFCIIKESEIVINSIEKPVKAKRGRKQKEHQ